MILEVCVDSFDSMDTAMKAGADRIELCSALELGGLTPSYGLMEKASACKDVEVFVMIRPRAGDFLYSEEEFDVMKRDVLKAKELGLTGIVTGILLSDGSIDLKRMKELVTLSHPLPVSFHRAFDDAQEPDRQISDLIDMGVIRILTSGMEESAWEAPDYLKSLQDTFGDQITIMPGAGIRPENIRMLAEKTGCSSFHMSGKSRSESKMEYRADLERRKSASEIYSNNYADYEKIRSVREVLDHI